MQCGKIYTIIQWMSTFLREISFVMPTRLVMWDAFYSLKYCISALLFWDTLFYFKNVPPIFLYSNCQNGLVLVRTCTNKAEYCKHSHKSCWLKCLERCRNIPFDSKQYKVLGHIYFITEVCIFKIFCFI